MDKIELSGVDNDAMEMDLDLDLDLAEDDRTKSKKTKKEALDVESNDTHNAEEDGSHRLIPKTVLSVLLVEADDSTRRIIAALLRKCSYRVSAVPDGLKAWETLKGRPHNVDLILTEVDLPSISGYALLTLVMEHDICKHIPVIMMSSCDTVSMVLKCMLKGAADFLIKPIRKNELKNLWQHVWRRHTKISGKFPMNITVGQREVDATSDNDEGSNYSSDCEASRKKIKECSEKGSDAQSSCTTPYLEAESRCMPNMQGLSPLKDGTAPNLNMSNKKHGFSAYMDKESDILGSNIREKFDNAAKSKACNSVPSRMKEDCAFEEIRSQNVVVRPDFYRVVADGACEMNSYNNKDTEPFSGVIDLLGKFDNNLKRIKRVCKFDDDHECINRLASSNDASTIKLEFSPQLELSLRRIFPAKPKGQWSENRHVLNHSNASAFSSYNSCKMMKPPCLAQPNAPTKSDTSANESPRPLPSLLSGNSGCTYQRHGVPARNSKNNRSPMVAGGFDQAEHQILQAQLGLHPASDLVFDKTFAGHNHSMFYTPSVLPRMPNTRSTCQQEQSPISLDATFDDYHDISTRRKVNQYVENTHNTIDRVAEELKHESPSATHSASSSLCNGTDLIPSNTYGSICSQTEGNISSCVVGDKTAASENMISTNVFTYEGFKGLDSPRSRHREAALEKFRLKRKDRCYEKKVRYQSRKRLAEQRPRVKGQFVRQRPSDPPASDSGCQ